MEAEEVGAQNGTGNPGKAKRVIQSQARELERQLFSSVCRNVSAISRHKFGSTSSRRSRCGLKGEN